MTKQLNVTQKEINIAEIEKFIYSLSDEELEEVIKDLSAEQKLLVYSMRFFKKIFDNDTLYKKAQNMVGEMVYETLINE